MWWVYALLSALFASLTAIFAKIGVLKIDSTLATAIRTVVVLIMLWTIVIARNDAKDFTALSKQNIVFLVLSDISTGLSWLFCFKALQLGDVSLIAPIDKLSIALTVVLATLFLGETLTVKTILGSLLIIIGVFILILK